MRTVLSEVMTISDELESHYRELLISFKLDKMDETVMEFEREVRDTKGQISNDRIRYYSGMFSYYAYALNATLSKQSLRSDVAEFYLSHESAKRYITQEDSTKKLTREDKSALVKVQTEDEEKVKILYTRVTQAVETRIKALYKFLDTLNMLGAMNMSEAKLGGRQ